MINSNYCLVCHSQIRQPISWTDLVSKAPELTPYLCSECEGKLDINPGGCAICDRPFITTKADAKKIKHGDLAIDRYRTPTSAESFKGVEGKICYDCIRWEKDPNWSRALHRNYSLFLYNEFLKETFAKFKYRGDYALAKIFIKFINQKLSTINYDIVIPIPLSPTRNYERGFNQVEALLDTSSISYHTALIRTNDEKQAKKSRQDRLKTDHFFKIKNRANFYNQRILLVDDIYTTGTTLRSAAKELISAGAKTVKSLTIARG